MSFPQQEHCKSSLLVCHYYYLHIQWKKYKFSEEKEILIFNSKLFLGLTQHFICFYAQCILFGNMSAEKIVILLDIKLQALFHSQT